MKTFNPFLYAVTDRSCLKNGISLYDALNAALEGGVTLVQLREKNISEEEYITEALQIKELCHSFNVPLIINDNVRVCMESDADGVHLGQNDMPCDIAREILGQHKIIGVTARTPEQAKAAQFMGADYIGSGAVFGTSTKSDAVKMNMSVLKSICSSVSIPIVAIGGINKDNVMFLEGTGIHGIAAVSGIFSEESAEEISKTSRLLFSCLEKITGSDK